MQINKLTLTSPEFPEALRQIPSPPKQLFLAGAPLDEIMKRPRVAIVGSRKVSPYGQRVTTQLARQLAEQGVVIISGLALGIDAIAHQAALDAHGLTVAVLPGPLEAIVPATNRHLALSIVEQGGALVSEYEADAFTGKQNFVARNRLVAGLADAVLVTEAAQKSGSLHTAKFAAKQGKPVMAVPGNITSSLSDGTNSLIKDGALAITSQFDVLKVLGLANHSTPKRKVCGRNDAEQAILDLLIGGVTDSDQLLKKSGLSVSEFGQTLTMLEIGGITKAVAGNQWSLR